MTKRDIFVDNYRSAKRLIRGFIILVLIGRGLEPKFYRIATKLGRFLEVPLREAGWGLLLEFLLDYCKTEGLAEVRGTALQGNDRMLGLANALGFSVAFDADDGPVMRIFMRDWHSDGVNQS